MQSKLNLLGSSVLRGVQMLFGIVVLGLSVTLIRDHNRAPTQSGWETYTFPKAPIILSLVAAIGGVSFAAAVFSLVVAWTNLLREYIEMVVDIIVIIANVVGGTIITIRLHGKNCGDTSDKNRYGSGLFPYTGSLASIHILNGGCAHNEENTNDGYCKNTINENGPKQLNVRCKQSQTDSVFMFLTVVICFATMVLTFMRMKKNL